VKFEDFSPPSSPSLDQQRDALQKGLGRAMQWALNERLADEPLLAACLLDGRFDVQVEGSRGDWLWRMIHAVGATERFRAPILHALYELSDERSAKQLCELACHYAKLGDESFRSRLYEIVEQKPISDSPWIGEADIVDLDGEEAFLFSARVRGERLATIEWEWDDGSLADEIVEQFGEERTVSLLSASTDAGIKRFYENWREQVDGRSARTQSHRDRMRSYLVDDIIEAASGQDQCFWFRGWGMHADESGLKSIVAALWAADEPNVISRLLRVFSNRSLPEFDPRMIELCQHNDKDVQRWAFNALAKNSHAAIRSFAIQQLAIEATGPAISLFTKNFENGDEERILEAMSLPEDPCQLHWLLMDVIKVLETNLEADCSKLAVITYGSTPCQNCRFDAARLLHKQKVTPVWLVEECRFDAEELSRQLFEELVSG
jgi:hypothetical protein